MKFAIVLSILLVSTQATAGDWPQILGPQRNGIAADEHLAKKWPRGGPPQLWSRPVGSGHAGLSVSGQRGILFHRIRNKEIVEGIDVTTGETLYKDESPTTFVPQVGEGDGPLCVPTIQNGRVITYGAQGVLTCLDFETGKRLWQRQTHKEFRASEGYFGAGSSPLIHENSVIVNVGGRDGGGIVAFSLETGETLWQKTDEPASYSAPILTLIDGAPFVLMVTRYKCLLLNPSSGAVLFQFPFGQRGPSVNGACPIVMGDRLLVTSSYGIGAVYAEFNIFGAVPLFSSDRPIATQYCTPIYLNGHIYLVNGRDDIPPADLECIELAALNPKAMTGKPDALSAGATVTARKWTEQNFGYGTLILAGGSLLAQKTNGELLLISPDPDRLKVISRCHPLRGVTRALPALSNGRYFLRNEETLTCLNLGTGL